MNKKISNGDAVLTFVKMDNNEEVEKCSEIMSSSDPWKKLNIGFKECVGFFNSYKNKTYVAYFGGKIAGFVTIEMEGTFSGYIKRIAVSEELRGNNIGEKIMKYAEEIIFKSKPNVFLCVSSFNRSAKRFYEKLGYKQIGEIDNFIVNGFSEIIMRKTIAPVLGYQASPRSEKNE